MKYHFISHHNSPDLILIFAGWGMDEKPFCELNSIGCDCCICYDYTILDFDKSHFQSYQYIYVYAWSFGVWASSIVMENTTLPVIKSTAINGTIPAIDDEYGIPHNIFQGTLEFLNEHTLQKFYRRMCGKKEILDFFLEHQPERELKDLKAELESIGNQAKDIGIPQYQWDEIIIGVRDMIFPVENQKKAWNSHPHVIMTDDSHFFNFSRKIYGDRTDKELIAARFGKTAKTYHTNAYVQMYIADKLNSLIHFNSTPLKSHMLEIGCGTGFLTQKLAGEYLPQTLVANDLCNEMESFISEIQTKYKFIPGDAEKIIFPGIYNLIASSSAIQWFTDLEKFLRKIEKNLAQKGFIAFSTFGINNLLEIKKITGNGLKYESIEYLKTLFSRYFDSVEITEEIISLEFPTPRDVLLHLKSTGVNGITKENWNKSRLTRFESDYRKLYGTEKGVSLTYHPVYITGQKKQI